MRAYDIPTRTEGISDDEFLDLMDQTCDETFVEQLLQGYSEDDPEWMTAQHYCGEGILTGK